MLLKLSLVEEIALGQGLVLLLVLSEIVGSEGWRR
jgi:hypothetical protein